jgi:hypothetical protein
MKCFYIEKDTIHFEKCKPLKKGTEKNNVKKCKEIFAF